MKIILAICLVHSILLVLFLLMDIRFAGAVTPIKFYRHYDAVIEAWVADIWTVNVPMLGTDSFMKGETKPNSMMSMPVEKIQLRVISILRSEGMRRNTEKIIRKDSVITLMNPWLDQKAPFKPGDKIRVEVQLVSPDETFDLSGIDNQWWFLNEEERDFLRSARLPCKNLRILD